MRYLEKEDLKKSQDINEQSNVKEELESVGQLKWSKEEEIEQNTLLNLTKEKNKEKEIEEEPSKSSMEDILAPVNFKDYSLGDEDNTKEFTEEKNSQLDYKKLILKYLWIPILLIAVFFIGTIIGFVFIGKQSFSEVFNLYMWKHIYDLIYG